LFTCPGISEVQVVGLPDVKYGEQVMAWIKLEESARLTAEDVQRFCAGKIAAYKIPRYIKFVTSFPLTVTGKVQKFRMREISIQELQLEQAAKIETA
jgi:fatty-acyl-CoA synthase